MQTTPTDDGRRAPAVGSLSALIAHLIDYAGLFPPAGLDMAATVDNYARYLAGGDAWMLDRLIVPVHRLDELEAVATRHLPGDGDEEPWRLSGLVSPAGDDAIPGEVERIARFNERHRKPEAGRAVIDVVELKAADAAAIESTLDLLPDDLYPFFELPVADDPRGMISALVGGDAGAKIRTGGVTADLYPCSEHVARFVCACAAADVPFKATAGLHHPLRHHAPQVDAWEFGFLNVFVAAGLALVADLAADELLPLLEETSIEAFAFDDAGLAWRDQRLSVEEIGDTRLAFAISFGSCSFDEPRADLRALNLLGS